MDITVYLPDETGTSAKEAGLNFSGLLRGAVTAELARREVVAETAAGAQPYELDLEDQDGRPYTGRVVGTRIAEDGDVEVFLTEDERVIVYDGRNLKAHDLSADRYGDVGEQLREWLSDDDAYVEAMYALGERPVVDL